ncbi:anti-virulence regulator CigR family protein [Azotobacter armeniacus]
MRKTSRLLAVAATLTFATSVHSALPSEKEHRQGSHHHGDSDLPLRVQAPTIDIGRVRLVLGENRRLIGYAQTLPPGVRKKPARGQPLPPGIAKSFDGRLVSQLPHYDGYEWRQVGTDVVLVTLATGLIHEVLHDVLH